MRNPLTTFLGIMLLALLVLQGCGRKGPLFMPKNNPQPTQSEQKK